MSPLGIALGLLNLVALCALFLYASNAYVMVALHWRHRRDPQAVPPLPDPLPFVTVQLPLFNERYVAARLLQAVGMFEYPRERLEIQVLDDSTDDTPDIVAAVAAQLRAKGIDVLHLRRQVRTGFKAGALAEGLTCARGEFIAIFDADFVPPPDFLEATLGHFAPDVAVVQTRWGHLNRRFSPLTLAQSLGIDGHFAVEQTARARSGLLLNFNGTAGVWRKAAILDAGGWAHDTLTEDLDLSYRAQLRGWRIVYRPDIVSPAELPVVVAGFKSQQRRWAKGSIQTARKLLPALWRSPLGWWKKYQGTLHLTYYLIHPLMLLGVFLAFPLRALAVLGPDSAAPSWVGGIFALATLGPASMLLYAQRTLDPAWWRRAWELATVMVIGVGLALSTSLAVLGAFLGRGREFIRTPKFGIAGTTGSWRGKSYAAGSPWGGIAELALGGYCAVTAWVFYSDGQYAVTPFLALYAAGFLSVGTLTVVQSPGFRWSWTIRMRRRAQVGAGVLLMILGALSLAAAAAGEANSPLVAEGERLWTQSPDPSNPVACATCHWDAGAIRHWAPSFPKFKPLPPPAASVMTLLQANAEAVERHYRLSDPLPVATAITAYLAALGRELPTTPGITPDQPVFPQRLQALAASVRRGGRAFANRCQSCHRPADLAPAVRRLPRLEEGTAQSLETYLEGHVGEPRLRWDGQPVADLIAYLASHLATAETGEDFHQTRKEDP
jgi:cellulose synthase/poly-beta-1,6-N-acetylglucosamine synthase-like glycosyltransferase/mono/diheme cytochrome c family protein